MNCSKCNAEIPAESKFCPHCGNSVQQAVSKKFCTNCGAALADGVLFCTECGSPVAQMAQAVPAAPVAPVEPVQAVPVAEVPVAQPVASAIPVPVNDVPAVSAVPTPVNDIQAQPVSAIPMPVNDVPATTAIPTPVNDVAGSTAASQAAFVAAASTMTAPANQQMAPTGGIDLNKGGAAPVDFAGMTAASAAVAAPVTKKKSKIGLWIGLGVGAVVIAAAAVVGLCFRGVATNLVVGNNKYASMIEGDSIKAVSATVEKAADEEMFTQGTGEVMNTALTMMNTMSDAGFEGEDMDVSSLNLEQMISTMYSTMMDYAGINYAEYIIDADIDLTAAGKNALGVDDGSLDEIIDHINKGEIKFSCTYAEDSLDAYVAVTDGTGFTLDARGVVCSDGTVGVMFPFGSNKCIGVKLDVNGEVQKVEEIEFKVDEKEIDRLTQEIIEIYLAYVEKAEVEVNGNAEVTAGDITEKGRLIVADLSAELVEQMLGEILTHIANDTYFTNLITEYSTEMDLDYNTDYFKQALLDAAEELEGAVAIGFRIETLVDNNGNILAKSYVAKDASLSTDSDDEDEDDEEIADMMALYDEYGFEYGVEAGEVEEIKITIIVKEDVSVFSVFADNEEMMYAKAQAKNETDGSVRLVLNDDGMTVSLNIDYEGVKYEKFFNTEMLVGKFTIYTAGTEESLPDGSAYKVFFENAVNGNKYTSRITADIEPYGSFGLAVSMIGDNVTAEGIPSGAYIIDDLENVNEESAVEIAEYVQGMLTDIKTALENNGSSPLVAVIYDGVEELSAELDDVLNPKADYEDISDLSDEIYELQDTLASAYDEHYMLISDELFEEIQSVYDDISELSDELFYADEIDMETFQDYRNAFEGYKETANELLDRIAELVENAQENSVPVVGMYDVDTVYLYGEEYDGSDIYEYYTMDIREDGTFVMDCEGDIEEGTWYVMDNTLYAEDDYGNSITFTIENDRLIYDEGTVDFTMEFVKR